MELIKLEFIQNKHVFLCKTNNVIEIIYLSKLACLVSLRRNPARFLSCF